MRYCWTLVMAAGLLGMNAAGWMAYQSKPKPAPRQAAEPPKPEEKERPKPPDPVETAKPTDARIKEGTPPVTPPPPEKMLDGELLVLVLRTPTSSLANTDFRAGLKGLEDALGRKGSLLGGKVWVLDGRGPQPWDPAAEYPPAAALDNRDFAKLVEAIKDATAKLDARALRSSFRVVVVWETDNKIAGPIELPGRRYSLAYRYTLGDEDIKGLDESFVFASRFRSPGAVQKEVTYVATMKATGGTP